MSVLTHSPNLFRGFRSEARGSARSASHVAVIKRFAKFAGALLMMALAVATVGGIKLAFYWPHFAY
jgi:hypothetical protein